MATRGADGKFVSKEISEEVDWSKDELEFNTPDGVAKYIYMGKLPWVQEKRKLVQMRGYDTWAADGVVEVLLPGECMQCGKKMYKCVTHPITADQEMSGRTPHIVKNSSHEPPSIYCDDCVYEANPNLLEQVIAGKRTAEEIERDAFLAEVTHRLGGAR